MSNSEILRDSLAGIEKKLTAIESQLEATKEEIQSKLGALGIAHLHGEPTRNVAQDALSAASGLELKRINQANQKLAAAKNQSQILATYLEEAQAFVARGALFLQQNQEYVAWKSIGFDLEHLESVSSRDQANPIARAAFQKQIVISGENLDQTFPWLKQCGELPLMTLCIPLVFEDYVPIVLYVDGSDEIPVDSLELLTHVAVLVVKNHYLQQLVATESGDRETEASEIVHSPEPSQASMEEKQPHETAPTAQITEMSDEAESDRSAENSQSFHQQEPEKPTQGESTSQPKEESFASSQVQGEPKSDETIPSGIHEIREAPPLAPHPPSPMPPDQDASQPPRSTPPSQEKDL